MQRNSRMVPHEAIDLTGIDAFLIDLDGVLYTGTTPIPGGAETLTLLDQLGYRMSSPTLPSGPVPRSRRSCNRWGSPSTVLRSSHHQWRPSH